MKKQEIIDVNCMLGKWAPEPLEFSEEGELLAQMDYFGISQALCFHALAWKGHPIYGNREIMKVKNRKRLKLCWTVLPEITGETESGDELMEIIVKNDISALRFFPNAYHYHLDEKFFGDGFARLEELEIPLIFEHSLSLDGAMVNLGELYKLCERYPKIPVVLVNPGIRSIRPLLPFFKNLGNFYVGTSTFSLHGGIAYVTKRFGCRKLVFDSRMPFQSAGSALAMVNYAAISQSEKEAILGGTMGEVLANYEEKRRHFFKQR